MEWRDVLVSLFFDLDFEFDFDFEFEFDLWALRWLRGWLALRVLCGVRIPCPMRLVIRKVSSLSTSTSSRALSHCGASLTGCVGSSVAKPALYSCIKASTVAACSERLARAVVIAWSIRPRLSSAVMVPSGVCLNSYSGRNHDSCSAMVLALVEAGSLSGSLSASMAASPILSTRSTSSLVLKRCWAIVFAAAAMVGRSVDSSG